MITRSRKYSTFCPLARRSLTFVVVTFAGKLRVLIEIILRGDMLSHEFQSSL